MSVSGYLSEVHDLLSRRYDEAYEASTRQDLVVDAMRADNAGPGNEADHAQFEKQVAAADALRVQLNNLGVAIERTETGSYGYGCCVGCGQVIAVSRLRVFPATIHCSTCNEQLEQD